MTDAEIDTVIQIRMAARYLTLDKRESVRNYAGNILANCDDLEAEMNGEVFRTQTAEEMRHALRGALSYGSGK